MTIQKDNDIALTEPLVAPTAPPAIIASVYDQSTAAPSTYIPVAPTNPVAVTDEPVGGSTTTTTITYDYVKPPPQVVYSRPPPGGLAAGGVWGTAKYCGPQTWGMGALWSVVGIFFVLFPCGIFAVFCPCDQREVYLLNGRIYDESGKDVGSPNRFRRY